MMQSKKPRRRGQAYWPVIGLLLAGALAFLAYVLAPNVVIPFLSRTLPNFPPADVPADTLNLIVTGVVFVVLGLLATLIVAAAAPKKKSQVTEKKLVKEREEMIRAKVAQKRRQQQINRMNKSR